MNGPSYDCRGWLISSLTNTNVCFCKTQAHAKNGIGSRSDQIEDGGNWEWTSIVLWQGLTVYGQLTTRDVSYA